MAKILGDNHFWSTNKVKINLHLPHKIYPYGFCESSLQYEDCKKNQNLPTFMVNIQGLTAPKFDLD